MFRTRPLFRTLVLATSLAAGSPLLAEAPGTFGGTCRYYASRAAAPAGGERADWLALLAESCRQALKRYDTRSAQGLRAELADRDYLERLDALRQVVMSMNVARFTQGRGTGHGGLQIRRSVTPSGEYLIARQIGVMDAFTVWAKVADFTTAELPAG